MNAEAMNCGKSVSILQVKRQADDFRLNGAGPSGMSWARHWGAEVSLTDKQQRFVQEYLKDLNGTQAAIRAGYSAKTAQEQASRLLSNAMVAKAVSEAKKERAEEVGIDAAYVLRQAVKLHERCMQEVAPILDRKGQQVTDEAGNLLFEFNAAGAAKALELVGKHVDVGAFKERVEHSGKIELETLTEEQLAAKIDALLGANAG